MIARARFPLGAAACERGLAAELARIAREIDRRTTEILTGADLSPERVHGGRIATKRVRAYWQLHKPTRHAAAAEVAIDRLRRAARSLAVPRDGYVHRRFLAEMGAEAPAASAAAFEQADERLASALPTADSSHIRDELVAALAADATDWLGLEPIDDAHLLRAGLRRSFLKAQELGSNALLDGLAESLHRWRRWVKYLRYQLEPFVTPRRPAVGAWYAELEELGGVLGRRNDLHLLRQALGPGAPAPVLAAIDERDRALAAALPKLEDTLFALPAERFLASVGAELAV